MMKKLNLKLVLAMVTLLVVWSCKKGDDPKPMPPQLAEVIINTDTIHPVRHIKEIKLYVPENKNMLDYKFYNITTGTYSNDVSSDIELAYFFNPTASSVNHLGSSQWDAMRGRHNISNINQTAVTFYDIADGFSPILYDTLKDERSIAGIIFGGSGTTSAISGGIQSDEHGWLKDEIIGFKLSNGKRGLIKLTRDPVEAYHHIKTDSLIDGTLIFDIKMEQ